MDEDRLDRAFALLFLERSRALVRTRFGRPLAAAVAIVYGIIALFVGEMIVLGAEPYATTSWQLVVPEYTNAWWDYPAILVTGPWGVLTLPFLPAVTMVVVSLGVGIGMTVGILLTLRLRKAARSGASGSAVSSAAGFTPALIALVTLGACCSTTAAATAGIGAIAQASGTGIDQLLFNNWYLDVFQVGVLWIALLAQEQLLVIYGGLLGDPEASGAATVPTPLGRRSGPPAALRVVLLGGGVVWGVSAVVAWTSFDPVPVTAGLLAQALVQHLLLAALAVAAGLFGASAIAPLGRESPRAALLALRAALVVAGGSVLAYVPPPLAGAGLFGFGNELLGAVGAPSSWGAVAPPTVAPTVLLLRWTLEFLLLGGFAVAVGVAPGRIARWFAAADTGGALAATPTAPGASANASGPSPGTTSIAPRAVGIEPSSNDASPD